MNAVAEGDCAGLVEEEGADVAGGLDGTARHGEDVALDEPVHTRDADRGQQGADGCGNEGDEDGGGLGGVGVLGYRLEGDDDQKEDDGERGEQDI